MGAHRGALQTGRTSSSRSSSSASSAASSTSSASSKASSSSPASSAASSSSSSSSWGRAENVRAAAQALHRPGCGGAKGEPPGPETRGRKKRPPPSLARRAAQRFGRGQAEVRLRAAVVCLRRRLCRGLQDEISGPATQGTVQAGPPPPPCGDSTSRAAQRFDRGRASEPPPSPSSIWPSRRAFLRRACRKGTRRRAGQAPGCRAHRASKTLSRRGRRHPKL